MKRIIASVAVACALGAAGAAAAQSIDDRIDRIEHRVDHGVDRQLLSEEQANRLRADLSEVRNQRDDLEDRGQLTAWRSRDLESRLDSIAYQVSREEYFTRYGTFRGYRQGWDYDDGY